MNVFPRTYGFAMTWHIASSKNVAMLQDRRRVLRYLAAIGVAPFLRPLASLAAAAPMTRAIPSSGEQIPVIGLGSWITFNVGDDRVARDQCAEVIRAFLASGGRVIDSSPMYGSSETVIGYALTKLGRPRVFSAEKVWTSSAGAA